MSDTKAAAERSQWDGDRCTCSDCGIASYSMFPLVGDVPRCRTCASKFIYPRWPRGRYNGQRIVGVTFKFKIDVTMWLWKNFGGLYMLNAYAFRATDPKDMKAASNPIGPGNDEALAYYRTRVSCVIAAWGVHCDPSRARDVCHILRSPVYCLGRTESGAPKHPLYLPANTERTLFDAT